MDTFSERSQIPDRGMVQPQFHQRRAQKRRKVRNGRLADIQINQRCAPQGSKVRDSLIFATAQYGQRHPGERAQVPSFTPEHREFAQLHSTQRGKVGYMRLPDLENFQGHPAQW